MFQTSDDCFVVYVRDEKKKFPFPRERKLVTCDSYAEAVQVRRENETPDRQCIIRFEGESGGGD